MGDNLFVDTPSLDFSPTPPGGPRIVAVQPEGIGPNNGFAIAVLVISIVAIIVCILIVFLVKPCPRGRNGRVEVIVDGDAAGGAAAAAGPAPVVAAGGSIAEPTSKAELDKEISNGKSVVMFHAGWCGHCQATAPEFRKAAAEMVTACPGMKIVMADGDKNREALGEHGVRGFPTIRLYKDGQAGEEYSGNRTAKSFVDFAKKTCSA